MKHRYSEQQFREAVVNSTSVRQVLIKLGVVPIGGNYTVFKKLAKKYSVDTSHFTGQGWLKNKKIGFKKDIEKYFNNEISIQSFKLKKRLLSDGYFPYQCSNCLLKEWLDKLIPLELDHIDGNNLNNNLSNLRILCPNCHAFTSTYRGKNKPCKT